MNLNIQILHDILFLISPVESAVNQIIKVFKKNWDTL